MEGDGGIIVLMEERVNSTYKWVMLILRRLLKQQRHLSHMVLERLLYFWKEEYALTNTEIGLLVSVINM